MTLEELILTYPKSFCQVEGDFNFSKAIGDVEKTKKLIADLQQAINLLIE